MVIWKLFKKNSLQIYMKLTLPLRKNLLGSKHKAINIYFETWFKVNAPILKPFEGFWGVKL